MSEKKLFRFPTAFSILFIILIIAVALTWIIPAGSYSKLTYNAANNHFVVKTYQQPDKILPATKESLDSLNIKIDLNNFTEGTIRKPIAVPGSYQRVEQNPKNVQDIAISMVEGTIEAADVMVFIFVLGGMIGVINRTGSFNAGLTALAKRTKGNEFFIVFSVCVLMAIGGTTCGIEEEAVAFYPILVPVFLALGYDAIVCVGAIFLASSMGTAFSTVIVLFCLIKNFIAWIERPCFICLKLTKRSDFSLISEIAGSKTLALKLSQRGYLSATCSHSFSSETKTVRSFSFELRY